MEVFGVNGESVLQWAPGSVPVVQILSSVTAWALLYTLIRLVLSTRTNEYCCRLVTLSHGALVVFLGVVIHIYLGPAPWNTFGRPSTSLHNLLLILSLGYFIFDFTWCCLVGSEEVPMLAHHVLSLVGLGYAVVTARYGAEVTAVCLGAEATNPLLQFRWFLREHDRYHTWVGVVNDYVFVFSFAFWRFGLGSYLLYRVMLTDKVDMTMKSGAVGLYLISCVFMYSVGKFFLRKYIWKMKKPGEKTE